MTRTMSLADVFSKAYENREVCKSFEAPMWLQSAIIHKQNEPKKDRSIVCSLVWPPVGKWREEMADISD